MPREKLGTKAKQIENLIEAFTLKCLLYSEGQFVTGLLRSRRPRDFFTTQGVEIC